MKKRFALLIGIVMLTLILAGCSSETEATETHGKYHLFQTYSADEYLNFLENFDEETYDIVDISVGHNHFKFTYAITYENK